MKYHDNNAAASDPLSLRLSHKKLRSLNPGLYGARSLLRRLTTGYTLKDVIAEHVFRGDSQPAVVVSTQPLLVTAYTDELDCVVLLKFNEQLTFEYELRVRSRLITINTYFPKPPYQKDLIIGKNQLNRWFGVYPIIADFVSDDNDRIEARKSAIKEREWEFTYDLGEAYMSEHPNVFRDGRPEYSFRSAIL